MEKEHGTITVNTKKPTAPPRMQRLGKQNATCDRRTFKLSKYLRRDIPPPTSTGGYQKRVSYWPMYLNDTLGDCVIAAAAHIIEQQAIYSGSSPTLLTEMDVMKGYQDVGGYVPGRAWTDRGCSMLKALNYWRQTGFGDGGKHKILAYVSVDATNVMEMSTAMMLFGSLFAGFALPLSCQGQPVWEVPHYGPYDDGSWGTWGGHAVPLVGWSFKPGHQGTLCVSWGMTIPVTWKFIHAYCDELYAVLSEDWIEKCGVAPNNFDLATLQEDLGLL